MILPPLSEFLSYWQEPLQEAAASVCKVVKHNKWSIFCVSFSHVLTVIGWLWWFETLKSIMSQLLMWNLEWFLQIQPHICMYGGYFHENF